MKKGDAFRFPAPPHTRSSSVTSRQFRLLGLGLGALMLEGSPVGA